MRQYQITIISLFALLLSACGGDRETKLQDSFTAENTADVVSNLDYGKSVIPFPNNILFINSTTGAPPADGTLDIPVKDANDLSDPKVAMNALDGFSTIAPISTGFTGALDSATFAKSVKFYEVTRGATGAIASVDKELSFGKDYIATLSSIDKTQSNLVILPLAPLKAKQTYMAVVTTQLKSESGSFVGPSASYVVTHGANPLHTAGVSNSSSLTDAQAQKLEPLRLATVAAETALKAFDSTASKDIVISWSFTTQSIADVLKATRAQNRALTSVASFGAIPTSATTVMSSPKDAAFINAGSIDVPYYLTAASPAVMRSANALATGSKASLSSAVAALGSCWNGKSPPSTSPPSSASNACAQGPHTTQYNPAPVATSTQTIPMLISIPKLVGNCTAMPASGWPVVIYQHGITTNRATMLAVADALAGACMAVVAIDMPMHGLTGNETNGTQALKGIPVAERTFDIDLITQDSAGKTTAATPDGIIDSSGSHFINLSNLLNTRDNVRQAVSDLFMVVHAIESGMSTTLTAASLDKDKIYFLGHSLGAMVGTTFLALEPNVKAATLAFGGVSLPKILDGSAAFGPTIAAGLATKGVVKGTANYESFLGAAQTVVDSSDPVNYATTAAENRGILFFEIVGGSDKPSDLVVPNKVPDANDKTGTVPAPLAGTEPQLTLMGLNHVNTTQAPSADDLKVVTKYISGSHSSLLDPTPDVAVITEIQTQMANFFASGGKFLKVTNPDVLLAPTLQ